MATTSSGIRPELLETVLRINLGDVFYRDLAASAGQLKTLLDSGVQADPNIVGSIDDLIGAIYSLVLARHHHFQDRLGPIEVRVVHTRAEQMEQGNVRVDGKWIAGWHFNGALLRLAAVFHRLLKVISGDLATKKPVPALLPRIETLYRAWKNDDWVHEHIDIVHAEVNALKHTPQGVHGGRTATFEDAMLGIRELLDLVETWRVNVAPGE